MLFIKGIFFFALLGFFSPEGAMAQPKKEPLNSSGITAGGKLDGFKKDFSGEKLFAECNYRNNVLNGEARFYFPHSGKLWREEFVTAGSVKKVREYDLDGKLVFDHEYNSPVQTACVDLERQKITGYVYGGTILPPIPADGVDIRYEDGKVYYRNYKHGKLNGYSLLFNELYGRLVSIRHYTEGVLEGVSLEFPETGRWESEGTRVSHKREGYSYPTYREGWQATSWKNGKKDGFQRDFAPEGKLVEVREFEEDRAVGVSRAYDPSGKIWRERIYFGGKEIRTCNVKDGRAYCRDEYAYETDCCSDFRAESTMAQMLKGGATPVWLVRIENVEDQETRTVEDYVYKGFERVFLKQKIKARVLVPLSGEGQAGQEFFFSYSKNMGPRNDHMMQRELGPEEDSVTFHSGEVYFLPLEVKTGGEIIFEGNRWTADTIPSDMASELEGIQLSPQAAWRFYEILLRVVEKHSSEGWWVLSQLSSFDFLRYLDVSGKRASFLDFLGRMILDDKTPKKSVQAAVRMFCYFKKAEQESLFEKIGRKHPRPDVAALLDQCVAERALPAKSAGRHSEEKDMGMHLLMLGSGSRCNVEEAKRFFVGAGSKATPYLIKALGANDDILCQRVVELLGVLGDARAIDPLFEMLGSKNYLLRVAAAASLGSFVDPVIAEVLGNTMLEAIRNDEINLFATIPYSLGRMKTDRATDVLLSLIEDPKAIQVRYVLIRLLGSKEADKVLEVLIRFLKDPDSQVKYSAAGALGQLSDARALPMLLEAFRPLDKEKDNAVYFEVLKAINKLSGKNCGFGDPKEACLKLWEQNKP